MCIICWLIHLSEIKIVFNIQHLKLKYRVLLTGYTVGMVTNNVKKMTTIYSSRIGYLFNTINVASTDEEWYR